MPSRQRKANIPSPKHKPRRFRLPQYSKQVGRRGWLLSAAMPQYRGGTHRLCVICYAVTDDAKQGTEPQTKTFIRGSYRGKQVLIEWGTICAECRAGVLWIYRRSRWNPRLAPPH
jgi:hypothetical protein